MWTNISKIPNHGLFLEWWNIIIWQRFLCQFDMANICKIFNSHFLMWAHQLDKKSHGKNWDLNYILVYISFLSPHYWTMTFFQMFEKNFVVFHGSSYGRILLNTSFAFGQWIFKKIAFEIYWPLETNRVTYNFEILNA